MKLNHFKTTLEVIFYDENYPTQNYYFIAPLQKKMFSNEKQPVENITLQPVMCLNRIWPNIL